MVEHEEIEQNLSMTKPIVQPHKVNGTHLFIINKIKGYAFFQKSAKK